MDGRSKAISTDAECRHQNTRLSTLSGRRLRPISVPRWDRRGSILPVRDAQPLDVPLVAPTWERGQHDPVRQVEKSVADVDGGIAWPYTVEFVLQRLHSKGLITDEAMDAGEDFRNDFRIGELD